jgi:hypothetical protein
VKAFRRPEKDVARPATPGAIRRAANITAASVENAKRVITKLGLDETFRRAPKVATGSRVVKTTSAARRIASASPRATGR